MKDKDTITFGEKQDPGYISLHRKIFNNKYYFCEKFTKMAAWIDLLLLANFKDSYFEVRGIGVSVSRGQLALSQQTLSQRWHWSVNRVKRFLLGLKMDGQIDYQNSNVTTLITILNYNNYQKTNRQTNRQTETKRKPNERHLNKDNKDNKDITTNNDAIPFDNFWDMYDKKVGSLQKLKSKWNHLSVSEKNEIIQYIPKYKISQPDKRFRKNPETFLNNRSWLDELIPNGKETNQVFSSHTKPVYK